MRFSELKGKRIFLLSLLFLLSLGVLGGAVYYSFFREDSGEDRAVRREPVRKPKPVRKLESSGEEKNLYSFKAFRNLFVEFYEKKFVEKLKENLKKDILRELKEEQKGEGKKESPEIDVYGFVCNGRCVVYTSEGVFFEGEVYEGFRILIRDGIVVFRKVKKDAGNRK